MPEISGAKVLEMAWFAMKILDADWDIRGSAYQYG